MTNPIHLPHLLEDFSRRRMNPPPSLSRMGCAPSRASGAAHPQGEGGSCHCWEHRAVTNPRKHPAAPRERLQVVGFGHQTGTGSQNISTSSTRMIDDTHRVQILITQPKTFLKINQFSILTRPRCLRTPRTVSSCKTSLILPLLRKIIPQYLLPQP